MLNFSEEIMLVGLSSMCRAQSDDMCEGLPRVESCTFQSCSWDLLSMIEYVRWFHSIFFQLWDTLWRTSPEAVKLPFCLRFPENVLFPSFHASFPQIGTFFSMFLGFVSLAVGIPSWHSGSDSEAAELEHLIQRGHKTSCGSTQSFYGDNACKKRP